MSKTAVVIDPVKLKVIEDKIKNPDYIFDAIDKIALTLTIKLIKD